MTVPAKQIMLIELVYDGMAMHSFEPEALKWFEDEVLGGELILHSNEIGDEIGRVRVLDGDAKIKSSKPNEIIPVPVVLEKETT